MKNWVRKVIANLIVFMLLFADFAPIGLGIVSYAEENQKGIEYSVKFVEITEENKTINTATEEVNSSVAEKENKAETEVEEKATEDNNVEVVSEKTETTSDAFINESENVSLLGVSLGNTSVEEENSNKGETAKTIENENKVEQETGIQNGQNLDVQLGPTVIDENVLTYEITNNEGDLPLGPAIEIRVKLNDNGYFKNPKVEIKDYESQIFTIRDGINYDSHVYSINDNKIKLNQINGNSEFIAYVPISLKDLDAIDIEKLQDGTTFNFTASYVSENSYEEIVSLSTKAVMDLNNSYSIGMSSFVEKYIPYTEEDVRKALVQIKVVGGKVGIQTLPAKSTTYEIELPKVENAQIENLNVFALSTAYTNGLSEGEVQFTVENWKYEDGKIIIKIENNPRDGLVYKSTGDDEFIVFFTYNNCPEEEDVILDSAITMKAELYTSTGVMEKAMQENYQFSLFDANKNVITYEVSGKTKEISKGYLFGNLNQEEVIEPVQYENTLNVNISRVDLLHKVLISEANEYFEDELGNKYPTRVGDEANSFYKEIKLNKENLDNILGENGSIELQTATGETLIVINKDTPEDGDGYVRVSFGDSIVDKLNFVINSPEEDGILNLTATKNIFKTSYEKTDLMLFKAIVAEYGAKAELELGIETDMGSTNVVTLLKDTMSKAEISIDKSDISTLVENENVQLFVSLNNAEDSSDMYSNPVFEIIFPIEIKNIDITDYNLLYGNDELSISNVETTTTEEGNIMLRISLVGKQKTYTAGDSSNGTTVVLNANISSDVYQASKNSKLKMNYYNEDATEYGISNDWAMTVDITSPTILIESGYDETDLNIVAPEGLVNIQKLYNYNGDRTVMSANQGTKEDTIETFEDYVVAKSQIIVINNKNEDLENYMILGRTPFEGNKAIIGDYPLGTNMTAPMVSNIVPVDTKDYTYTIYYSENGNATSDINNPENAWTEVVEEFGNIKSYLIVFNESFKAADTVRFEYDFEIPDKLKNEIDIEETFASAYQYGSDLDWVEADKVILSTGEAPILSVETYLESDLTQAIDGQRIKYTTKVTNEGRVKAKNVQISSIIPTGTTLVENGILNNDKKEVIIEIPEIRPGATEYRTCEVEVGINNNSPSMYIEPEAKVKADGLEKKIESKVNKSIPVKKAEVTLDIKTDRTEDLIGENENITYILQIGNIEAIDLKNCEVVADIPEGIEILDSYIEKYNSGNAVRGESGNIDITAGKVYWNLDKIDFFETFKIEARTKFIENKTQDISMKFRLKSSSLQNEYTSNELKKTIGKPIIETKTYANLSSKYVKEGDSLQFVLNMKNVGGIEATKLNLENNIPEEFTVTDLSYSKGNESFKGLAVQNAGVNINLAKNEEAQIVINCTAKNLRNNELEKLTTSSWSISGANIEKTYVEPVQTIIEQNPNVPENTYENIFASNMDPTTTRRYEVVLNEEENEEPIKKFKIIGVAFEDLNKNGELDENEQFMENVVAKLCDANTQAIISQTITNKAGEYLFEDLDAGEYYIKFEFDKDYYAVTSYKKSGIRENKNSDAINSNGKSVTDKIKIKDKSISDMNIGLVKTGIFDLELDVNVNRMAVSEDGKTSAYNMENSKLAKLDLRSKKMNNMQVTAEYTITVTNKGEVAGYAKQIKCELSDKLTLDTTINPVWYVGSDGFVYTTALSNKPINPGETVSLKLYFFKDKLKDQTGLYSNSFEIVKEYNDYALEDAYTDNNKSSADFIIGVETGPNLLIYAIVVCVTLTILMIGLFLTKRLIELDIARKAPFLEEDIIIDQDNLKEINDSQKKD